MGLYWTSGHSSYAFEPDPENQGNRDPDKDEAPETPLDEPRPPRVQDPPPSLTGRVHSWFRPGSSATNGGSGEYR